MSDCIKYRDAISAFVDGELSTEESEALMNHISQCEECSRLLNEYKEVSALFAADEEVPENLVTNVMSEVRRIKAAKRINFITKRVLPMAACLILVIGAVRLLPRMGNGAAMDAAAGDSAANSAAPMDNGAAADDSVSVQNYSVPYKVAEDGSYAVYAEDTEVCNEAAFDDVLADSAAEPEDIPNSSSRDLAFVITVYCDKATFSESLIPEVPDSVKSADFYEEDGLFKTNIPHEDMKLVVSSLDSMDLPYEIERSGADNSTVLLVIAPAE